MLRILYSFFFACPKKNQKKTPENDIQHVFGLRLDMAFVVSFFQLACLDT